MILRYQYGHYSFFCFVQQIHWQLRISLVTLQQTLHQFIMITIRQVRVIYSSWLIYSWVIKIIWRIIIIYISTIWNNLDNQWADWSSWSPCSFSCGKGFKMSVQRKIDCLLEKKSCINSPAKIKIERCFSKACEMVPKFDTQNLTKGKIR